MKVGKPPPRDQRFDAATRKRLKRWLSELRPFDRTLTTAHLIAYLRVRREWAAKQHLVSARPK